ncbi:MAG: putative addiction module antidote protein [Gammaproteobacteria bacterium]|nr:putative addiction module antidote protein [Gammaproteobacteria bacterium]MYH85858.1 putative addiction module antidote protein [Gammaproteobacteria bacterium]
MTVSFKPWDPVDYFRTQEEIVAYLNAAFEDGDPRLIAAALGDVARARGMTRVAADAGLGRESLYKALSVNGNASFATVLKVLDALGVRLQPQAIQSLEGVHETSASDDKRPARPGRSNIATGLPSSQWYRVSHCNR